MSGSVPCKPNQVYTALLKYHPFSAEGAEKGE